MVTLPDFISSNISRLNVENVVKPPKNPTTINIFKISDNISVLFNTYPNIIPINRHPKILTKNIPKIGVIKYFLDRTDTANLNIAPIPPPIKTERNL